GRLPAVVLRLVDDVGAHLVVAGAAGGADLLAVGAVGDLAFLAGGHPRLPEEGLRDLAVDVIEREHLVLALLPVGEEVHPDAVLPLRLREGLGPDLEAGMLPPTVQPLPPAGGRAPGRGG